jgi:superfamily II DNA or RNA helicase
MGSSNNNIKEHVYSLLEKHVTTYNQPDALEIENKLYILKKKLSTRFNHKLKHQLPEYFLDKYSDNFNETNLDDTISSIFELSPNQRFLKKFMSLNTKNRSLLLFHGVGVGKTCASISIAENFHNSYSNMKQTIVLSNKVIRQNFENELFDLKDIDNACVGNKYVQMVHNWQNIPKKQLLKKVKKNIENFYDFKGYLQFSNEIQKKKTTLSENEFANYIFKNYSNRLIIIDEVHNLRSNDTSMKKIPVLLQDVIKFSSNLRVLYLSATPMFDDYSEIVWLFNTLYSVEKGTQVLLPSDNLFNKNGTMYDIYKNKLIRFANKHVSYMRGENPFTFPLRLYPSINKDTNVLVKYPTKDVYNNIIPENEMLKFTEIIQSTMSDDQYSVYKTIDYKIDTISKEVEQDDENNDMQKRIQLSNIYYPNDGSSIVNIGKSGLLSVMDYSSSKSSIQFKYKSLSVRVFDENNLGKYSPKIKSIVDYIKKSKGIVIVYSKYIDAGVIPVAMALESEGYARYKAKNLLNDNNNKNKRKYEYTIISGDKKLTPSKESVISTIRSYENRNGDLIKIVIISQVATEGVDFKNVREIHLLEPWFNMSKVEQIVGRGVRRYSHINLPFDERNTTIYLHANTIPKPHDKESVDLRMYRISEIKQQKISQIERILKEGSVDCNLNKNVLYFDKDTINKKISITTSQNTKIDNLKLGDTDNSKLCDFQNCKIECIPKISKSKVIKKSLNFNVLSYEVNQYILRIFALFKKLDVTFMTYNQILNTFINISQDHQSILNYALSKIIDQKTNFKFRGIDSYIVHSSNKYIVHPLRLDDKKVPILLRYKEYLKRPSKLHLKYWKDKQNKKVVNVFENNGIMDQTVVSPKRIVLSATKRLHDEYERIENILSTVYVADELNKKTIWSMVIDRMNIYEHTSFVNYYKKYAIRDTSLLESLEDGLIYFVNDLNKIHKVYNYEQDKIVVYNDDGKEVKTTQGELANHMKNIVKKGNDKLNKININELLGMSEFSTKQKASSFKISKSNTVKNKKNISGAICVQTSQYTKNIMYEHIESAIGKMEYNKIQTDVQKLKKERLCVLYEYITRNIKDRYLRPMLVKLYHDTVENKKLI